MCSRSLCAATGLVAFLLAGCHQIQNDFNDFLTKHQNRREASHVWRDCHTAYRDQVYYIYDFGDGFRAGYAQVLGGGDPCPPTLPPEKYWYIKYQTPTGRERIDAWFSGHEAGVATALQDGVQDGNRIPLSPYRRAQLQGQGGCPTCFPPVQINPANDYEMVPPTPADEGVTGEYPTESEEPVTEAMDREFEGEVEPVDYRFSDAVVDQE